MRTILVVLAATVVVAGLALVAVLGAAVAGGVACPLALLEGELVAVASAPHADAASRPDTLGVRGAGGGDTVRVTWPFGYRVERQDGALVLVHLITPVGREGDWVSVGGGSADDGSFTACGPVSVGTSPAGAGRAAPWTSAVP